MARRVFRLVRSVLAGAALGAVFGVAFGLLASVFAGGPPPWEGARETAPFFAAAFALAGLVLTLERSDAELR